MLRFKRLQAQLREGLRGLHSRNLRDGGKGSKNYYDLLGITPKATQADIKKAYYNKSQEFHPDKRTGDEAKFREINTAYEVLGNLKLRKMYDRGLIPVAANVSGYETVHEAREQADFNMHEAFGRRPESRKPPTGRSSAYDYDEWIRRHYSDAFERKTKDKEYQQRLHEYQKQREEEYKQQILAERLVLGLILFMVVCSMIDHQIMSFEDPPKSTPRLKPLPPD